MIIALLLAFAVFGTQAQTAPNTAAATASTTAPTHTASVTGCHNHGADVFCIDGSGEEVQMSMSVTPTGGIPAQFTGCHSHGSEQHCKDPEGNGAFYMPESTTTDEHSHEESSGESGVNCHFHAGVEHCVGPGESEESSQSGTQCNVQDREYDVPLRIGTLFVVLVTSAIGVFAPMLLVKLPFRTINTMISTGIKQFGTGIIIATAFVHLYTHANLMFTNDCLGELEYEATTSAIVMAGIFLSFLVEYIGHRIILARGSKTPTTTLESPNPNPGAKDHQQPAPETTGLANLSHSHGPESINPNTKFSVLVMEAGIVFHSILIGITLVVAGDSFYRTLLVVIVFHQFFEGLALGVRIALLPGSIFPSKAIMGAAFAVITPVGMAIGIGVLHSFNGNDKSTLIALGTLDALSAGILVWVGVVDMWARDWVVTGGEMVDAGVGKVSVGGVALIAGLVLMSLLGKWA